MSWSKLFSNWTWHNKSTAKDTPLSAANLQKINDALDGTDTRATEMFNVMGDEWNSAITYAVGEVVRYEGLLYVCIVANTNVTPTNTIYWGETSVEGEIGSLNSNLSNCFRVINGSNSSTSIPANGRASVVVSLTVPSGYKLVAVNSIMVSGSNAEYLAINNFYLSNSGKNLTVYLRNESSSAITPSITVYVLCSPDAYTKIS